MSFAIDCIFLLTVDNSICPLQLLRQDDRNYSRILLRLTYNENEIMKRDWNGFSLFKAKRGGIMVQVNRLSYEIERVACCTNAIV